MTAPEVTLNSPTNTVHKALKPRPYQQQCRSNLRLCQKNRSICSIRQCCWCARGLTFHQCTDLCKLSALCLPMESNDTTYLDSSTACTIATSIVHSKLDYCNSLYYELPKSQLSSLQQIQNSLDRTVLKAPKSCHITPILRSLLWLRINERIEYKLLSLTYKVLTITQPPYLHNSSLFNVLTVLALRLLLLLLGHLHHLL